MKTQEKKMNLSTRLIHSGVDRDPFTGASSVPLYLGTTFDQRSAVDRSGFDYTRSGNPTREALEKAITDLEGGSTGLAFASGMAATSSALLLFKPGDHLIVSDSTDNRKVEQALTSRTRGIFVESPSNPLLKITDLPFIADFARKHKLISIIDNTFSTPYLQRPLELGFDIVVHSATKFLNGHSDVLAGLAVTRDENLGQQLRFVQNAFGAVLGVQDSWLLLRGLKTLAVRLEASQKSAVFLAHELSLHPKVKNVFYPGLEGHPGKLTHERQAYGPGAVLSFSLRDQDLTAAFMRKVTLPLVAVSLGGVETIISHPASMSHAAMSPEERHNRGIEDTLVRLSAGLEAPEDIWADIEQALAD